MFEEIVLLDYPRISLFKNVLTDEECQYIINKYTKIGMNPDAGKESNEQSLGQITEYVERRSISWDTSPEDRQFFKERLSKVVGMPVDHIEAGDIYKYETNEYFGLHHDFPYTPRKVPYYQKGGDRKGTAIFWLNGDQFEGGHTVFPLLEVDVAPVKNGMLYFEYDYPDETVNMSTWHEALKVTKGQKWIAAFFCANGPRVE